MRKLRVLFTLAFLAALPAVTLLALDGLFLSGCAPVVAALPTVVSVVTDAMLILDQIQTFAANYFAVKPNPELAKKVGETLAKCRSALDAALRASQGVDAASKQQVDQAFLDFRDAYNDLLALVEPLGIAVGGPGVRAAPGILVVPPPEALKLAKQ